MSKVEHPSLTRFCVPSRNFAFAHKTMRSLTKECKTGRY